MIVSGPAPAGQPSTGTSPLAAINASRSEQRPSAASESAEVVTGMVAAVAAVLGYKPVADVIVTGGFAIGVLAVPLWLLTTIFRKEA